MNPLTGILIFSAVETLTVALWAAVLGLAIKPGTQLLGIAVLFVGYTIEHVIAYNVGKGRPIFSSPKP